MLTNCCALPLNLLLSLLLLGTPAISPTSLSHQPFVHSSQFFATEYAITYLYFPLPPAPIPGMTGMNLTFTANYNDVEVRNLRNLYSHRLG